MFALALAIVVWLSLLSGTLVRNLLAIQVLHTVYAPDGAQAGIADIEMLVQNAQMATSWVGADTDPATQRLRGELYRLRHQPISAVEALDDATPCAEWLSCLLRGYLYMDEGDDEAAVQLWRHIPQSDVYFALQGDYRLDQGHIDDANRFYAISWNIANTLTPQKQTMLLNLCRQKRVAPTMSEAVTWCQRAVSAQRSVWTLIELGRTYYEARSYPEAIATLNEALELKPDAAAAYQWLGLSLWATGGQEAAVDALKRGIEIAPNNVWLHLHIANVYIQMKQFDAGRSHLLQARDLTDRVTVRNDIDRRLSALGITTDQDAPHEE